MDFVKVFFMSIGSIIALFISTKVIGNKQMSELSMFDYINGITIGSIAAEMATALENDFYYPLMAIAIYTIVIWLISIISEKSLKSRRIFAGRSIILMENGKLFEKNLRTSKIDINDFLAQCRINGYFNTDDIDTAILEQNGKISFLPKSDTKPLTPRDINLSPEQEKLSQVVILDGHIMTENLKRSGNNKKWLESELKKQKIGNIKDVYLAECDNNNNLSVFKRLEEAPKNDPFQ
ncbi:MAG: DUF421 domain-containing protein [Clostridia bacterium]|jgi:uncharacterized membrane protein YcaP (DUF421 family)|nr:DUF421 domain-containing protein [Clostridia bacterium]MCI8979352.1 DUF421 domain-containing protein [Clostridia bacterium]MCI9085343.1 DUF421 domain-containing protein [Clostridia bacterium]NDO20051.1 DUF421 domain-containing protein [Lachnospiraceae bacterium MD329]